MKKKEIQAEIIEKINQLIDELQAISNDEIIEQSKQIKSRLKDGYRLDSAVRVSIRLLLGDAIDEIFKEE